MQLPEGKIEIMLMILKLGLTLEEADKIIDSTIGATA